MLDHETQEILRHHDAIGELGPDDDGYEEYGEDVPCETYCPYPQGDPNARFTLDGKPVCEVCGWSKKAHS